jgi:hypothetical protein
MPSTGTGSSGTGSVDRWASSQFEDPWTVYQVGHRVEPGVTSAENSQVGHARTGDGEEHSEYHITDADWKSAGCRG